MKQKKIFITAVVLFILMAGLYYSISYQTEGEEEFFSVENSSLENPGKSDDKQGDQTEEISRAQKEDQTKETEDTSKEDVSLTGKSQICVYICGHVKQAGVYYLPENCRISDVVEMAGGFKREAAREQINLAKKLSDGEKIYIPSKKEASHVNKTVDYSQEQGELSDNELQQKEKVNLNEAGESVLMTLPGIGKSKAEAIVRYRTEHGTFKKIEEIKQIEGIKDGVFQKIKDFITI